MSLLGSNKGQIKSYMTVVIFLFIFGFMSILAYTILNSLVAAFAATGVYSDTMDATANGFLFSLAAYDYIIVILMICLIIAVGLTSYKLNTSPAFFIVSIIMSIFMGFVSYFFNYVFAQLVSPAVFATTLGVFPKTVLICQNLHWIALLAFVVGSITLYAKKDSGETSGLVQQ